MPKKSQKKEPKRLVFEHTANELAHRRWCVEQAMRWPDTPALASFADAAKSPPLRGEIDVIARAQKIFEWSTRRGK